MDFQELYSLGYLIGYGSFGKVYQGIHKPSGATVAIKAVPISSCDDRINANHEAAIWRRLDHGNIVAFKQIVKNTAYYYIVMEYINGVNLFDGILTMSTYTERNACVYMRQLLSALQYLSKKRIIHRDIKPDNILLKEEGGRNCLKLTDFGLAVCLPRGVTGAQCNPCGAPLYAAPEVILEKMIGDGVDVWACGVLLYILLSGYPPFWHEKPEMLLCSIVKHKVNFPSPYWDNVSLSAKDLIKKLLEKDKDARISSSNALRHTWICKDSTVPDIHRHNTLDKLRVFNARRKLQGVIFTVQAINRFKRRSLSYVENRHNDLVSILQSGSVNSNYQNYIPSEKSLKQVKINDNFERCRINSI